MNNLVKILSLGLILFKIWKEKKAYNAEMAEYNKQMEQYAIEKAEYEQEVDERAEKEGSNIKPNADYLLDGVTFNYNLFLKTWSGNDCKARLWLTIKNTSNIEYRFSNIKVQPLINGELSPSYATWPSLAVPKGILLLYDFEWGKYHQRDDFTSDNITLAIGSNWDKFQDTLGDNNDNKDVYEHGSNTQKNWWCFEPASKAGLGMDISFSVSIRNSQTGRYTDLGTFSRTITNGNLYYSNRSTQ